MRSISLFAAGIVLAGAVQAAAPASLPLYVGQAPDGASIVFGDFDVQQPLTGEAAGMPKDPRLPGAVVEARRTAKDAAGDALGLHWKNAWYATIRVETPPLDLRPYRARGVVAFDLKVNELASGGISFRLECGNDCERKVKDVLPARAAAGQGWQHRVLALDCLTRDGDDLSKVTRPFAMTGTGSGDIEIANVRIEAAGTPNMTCADYRTVSVTPEPLGESWALDWWMPRHEEKLAEIARRKAAGEKTEIVFIGDSITHNWEKPGTETLSGRRWWDERFGRYHPLDLGYGGDHTENVLWRLQRGEVDGIDPKMAVLMIGTNNAGERHDPPEVTVKGIARDVAELKQRLPHATILLLAIFPRGEKADDPLRRLNEQVNARLPALADGKHVRFLNLNAKFLAPDGTLSRDIMPDLLHPNEQGYRIWADALQPELDRLLH